MADMIVTREALRTALDEAEKNYWQCWQVLATWRSGTAKEGFVSGFLAFQPLLLSTLHDLSALHHRIAATKRILIRKKTQSNSRWTAMRLRALARYTKALRDAISIGKSLGACPSNHF